MTSTDRGRVVIIGSGTDPQVRAVTAELDERAPGTAFLWDCDRWPGNLRLQLDVGGADGPSAVFDDTPVALGELSAVWVRNLGLDPLYPRFRDALQQNAASVLTQLREYHGTLVSLLRSVESLGVPVVNPPATIGLHALKPWQLARLQAAGVPVPETRITTDVDAAQEFVARVGDVIAKPVSGGGLARRVTTDDLDDEWRDAIRRTPIQLQQRVVGRNLRIYVLDGRVVAAGWIVSDELDYRSSSHDAERADPGVALARAAVKAASALGLTFTGVDLLVRDDGSFAVLEANPSPMFATFDALTESSIAPTLAAWLAGERA